MKLFVLDTDILTLHQHGHAKVCHNVAQHDAEDLAVIERFHNLRASRIPIRNPDLKIAATVLQCDGTLVTRNTRDFAQVPGLRIVDWSVAAKT